jgi:hypothetical protein
MTNQVLIGVLVVQVLIGIVLYLPNEEESTAPEGPLLANFDPASVEQVQVTDLVGNQITLARAADGTWTLPDYGNYPVEAARVEGLLSRLQGLQATRLITRSESSHRRLQVAGDEFLRRIRLTGPDGEQTLYIGSLGGGSASHVRVNESPEVYLEQGISNQDANAQLSAWIDITYFSFPQMDVVGLTLTNAAGSFEFVNLEGAWQMVNVPEGQTFDPQKFNAFLSQAITLRLSEPLSQTEDPAWNLAEPVATLTLRVRELVPAETGNEAPPATDPTAQASVLATATPAPPTPVEQEYILVLGGQVEGDYVAKASHQDYYVRLAASTADNLLGKTIESFVITAATTPSP